ncbi:TonB-dependent receptor [Nubsella zeaxanthinifaciens]|uniref:TonB-dependent receptor n=1 Tax=Nubsella zeaxanthinifaciens TaxID=392412 RepID=UPI003D012605
MKTLKAIASLITLLSPLLVTAQSSKLNANYKSFQDEKIHLQLDKPHYAAGDIIWLKAYVTDYVSNKPSATSGVLYVDLINEKNKITQQLKFPIKGGTSWGNIELADTLSEGNYRISAYTQWMRNFGKDYFFNQDVKIGNSLTSNLVTQTTFTKGTDKSSALVKSSIKLTKRDGKPYANTKVAYQVMAGDKIKGLGNVVTDANGVLKINFNQLATVDESLPQYIAITLPQQSGFQNKKTIPIKLKAIKPDVQFLPEGGHLIDGLPCKIGIKAINENGLGENIKGVITDNEGLEVTTFEAPYLGMGYCILTPDVNKTYTAKIKLADGSTSTYNLPSIEKSGHQLAINSLDSTKIDIKVFTSKLLLNTAPLKLVARRGAKLLFDMAISTDQQISSLSIPKDMFPSGIIQFNLYNATEQPLSERMVFINNSQSIGEIKLNVHQLKNQYKKRDKVTIDIDALNNGTPVAGSFSISSVNVNNDGADEDNETNILTSLLLKSDLRGHIEKPNAYFAANNEESRLRLDNLMLTQAWRKFDWSKQDTLYNIKYLPEKNLQINGRVTTLGKKPLPSASTVLMFPNNKMLVANTETDDEGKFSFQDIYIEGENKFVIQASTKEGKKNVDVNINKIDDQQVQALTRLALETDVNSELSNYLNDNQDYFKELYKNGMLNKTNLLKTVTIVEKKTKMEEMTAPYSTNRNGPGRADQVISAKDLEFASSLKQFILAGRIRGVTIASGSSSDNALQITRYPYSEVSAEIDGVLIREFDVEQVAVDDIESIEVLLNPALLVMYGTTISDALLVISTKRGKSKSLADIHAPGLVASSIKGYSPAKLFYAPKYDVTDQNSSPDLRTTVYWNPNLTSGEDGKMTVSFYNGDKEGKHRIVIEGIDADGNLARKILNYQVKNIQ